MFLIMIMNYKSTVFVIKFGLSEGDGSHIGSIRERSRDCSQEIRIARLCVPGSNNPVEVSDRGCTITSRTNSAIRHPQAVEHA